MNELIKSSGSSLAFAVAFPPAIMLAVIAIVVMFVGRVPPPATILLIPILVLGGIAWRENWKAIITDQEKFQFAIEKRLSHNELTFLVLRIFTFLTGLLIIALLGWGIIAL